MTSLALFLDAEFSSSALAIYWLTALTDASGFSGFREAPADVTVDCLFTRTSISDGGLESRFYPTADCGYTVSRKL